MNRIIKEIYEPSICAYDDFSDRTMMPEASPVQGMILCAGKRVVNAAGQSLVCVTLDREYEDDDGVVEHKYSVGILGLADNDAVDAVEYETEREAHQHKAEKCAELIANFMGSGGRLFSANW